MSAADRHAGTVRGYYRSDRAWYAAANGKTQPEILVGQFVPNGGTTGEYAIRWMHVVPGRRLTPRLEAFGDAWEVLAMHRDLLDALAALDGTSPTAEAVEGVLRALGFEDLTPVDAPPGARVVHLPAEDTEGGQP